MNKTITNLMIAAVLIATAMYGGTIAAITALVGTLMIMIGIIKLDSRPSTGLMIFTLLGVVVLGGMIPAEWGNETPSTTGYTSPPPITSPVATTTPLNTNITTPTATLNLKSIAKDKLGATFLQITFILGAISIIYGINSTKKYEQQYALVGAAVVFISSYGMGWL